MTLISFKALSFDADGTLLGTSVGSQKGFENFFLEAAKSRGKEFTLSQLSPILLRLKKEELERRKQGYRPYVSALSARSHWLWVYQEVFDGMGLPNPGLMAEEFLARYETGEFTELYADVLPSLQKLKALGIPMILISNFSPILKEFLEKFKLSEFFKGILISGIEGVEKSDKSLFDKGVKMLGCSPSEVLHVGDNYEEDYLAGQSAGLQTVLLDREDRCDRPGVLKIKTLLELTEEQVFKKIPGSQQE